MDETPISPTDAKNLRFLRLLVTVLTATMILGLLAIVALLVIRFSTERPTLTMPASIQLPDGTRATAFTQSVDWYAVVTADNQILIFDRASGQLIQQVDVVPE